ncbi:MAG: hypothetical protein ABI871_00855 [Chthoniobacterales bacterium]
MRPQLLRFFFAIVAEIVICAGLKFSDDWTQETMPVRFVASAMLGGIAYWFAVAQYSRLTTLHRKVLIFWVVAIALRVVVLPLAPGDDFWRYRWEGRIQHAGFNPYVSAPEAPELAALAETEPDWGKINHREFAAIYPPGAEVVFAALRRLSENPILYKLLFAVADLGSVAILLRIIGGGDSHARSAWYAWNPLVVYSFAGSAHFDSLMILALLAGVLFLLRHEAANDARRKWVFAFGAATLLGLAISIKLVPLLLLPLCVFALGKRAVTLAVSLLIPASLSVFYGWPAIPIWDSLRRFAYVTRLNDLFWWLAEEFVWPNPHQKNYHYNVIIVGVAIGVSLLFLRNWKRGMLWVMGAALILSPVLHPWYCTWILPFATWRRSYAWHVLSISLFTYFLFWNERLFALPWHSEPWTRALIILPPAVAALLFWRQRRDTAGNLPLT